MNKRGIFLVAMMFLNGALVCVNAVLGSFTGLVFNVVALIALTLAFFTTRTWK